MVYEIHDYDSFRVAIDEICAFLSSRAVAKEKVFDCKLVSYELVGNVLQHADGSASLQVELDTQYIHIQVRSKQFYRPPQTGKCPETSAERGRGLYLVDQFSAERVFTEDGAIKVRISVV